MYSIEDFRNDPVFIRSIIDKWIASDDYNKMIDAKNYYNSENTTISEVRKQIYTDRKYTDQEGEIHISNVLIDNPYVSNYHITDGFVQDMIDQKVFTLLDKTPTIIGINPKTEQTLTNVIDYALQELATEASICGVAYGFIGSNTDTDGFDIKVLDSPNCIAFVDPMNSELKALVRFWYSVPALNNQQKIYAEVYKEDLYSLYSGVASLALIEQRGYFTVVESDSLSTQKTSKKWDSGLPIIRLRNNSQYSSDFTRAIKSKIDSIDIVMSDFANNLSDFQDIFWVLRGLDAVDAEDFGSFFETIKKTYQARLPEGADVTPQQVSIPYEAKLTFCQEMRKHLISNAGVIDTETMTGGSLTTTAIKAACQKLMLRVSKFEYEVYLSALQIVRFGMEFTGDTSKDPTIKFFKSMINNDAELINNINVSLPNISQRTYLENHPYVEDVEEELKRLDEEASSKFTVSETGAEGTTAEPTASTGEVQQAAEEVANKSLNGAQTQSLLAVMAQYSAKSLTLGQAVNIVSVAVGISKEEAQKIIEGLA